MKKIIYFCLLALALNFAVAYGQQLSKIELSDGSLINGEIVSFLNGVYTIKAATVGDITVACDKVVKIESASHVSTYRTTQPADLTQTQVSAYKQKLMENPENAAIVKGIAKNSGLQEMADDPEILDAA
ncbi:hypothetical protein MEO41_28105 [Dolichospermum sp. ST_sed4]|nr:hypothetical protein [Dolichospermum sp. ST_sed4]